MQIKTRAGISRLTAGLLSVGVLAAIGGCTHYEPEPNAPSPASSPEGVTQGRQVETIQPVGQPGAGQTLFNTDDEAVAAMVAAAKDQDHDKVHQILGPAWTELVSGDKVEDAAAFKEFSDHAAERSRIDKKDGATSILYVGNEDWPFPIPVKRMSDGKWFFDTEAGKEEILNRRVGANELEAIQTCHQYVAAQRQYASVDRDGSGVLKYAQHLISSPGTRDGLYWNASSPDDQSPFGPLIAQAEMEGYAPGASKTPQPYHGYHFRILKQQGPAAPGGEYNYVINGNMIAGFAMVAFPADYGQGGIMTFIVNHQGKLYQKDLGANTTELARRMGEYNPDSTWTLVNE